MRSNRFTFLALAVLLLLFPEVSSAFTSAFGPAYKGKAHHYSGSRIGLIVNGNPVNYVDPDGRVAKGFNSGYTGGSVNSSQSLAHNIGVVAGRVPYEVGSTINHPVVDYYPGLGPLKQATQSLTGSDFMSRSLTGGQRTGSAVAAGLGAIPIGVVAKAGAAAKAGVKALHGGPPLVNLASPQRTKHILTGDATGGGHLYPGAVGKSSFPQGWSAERAMHEISDVATDPSSIFTLGRGGRTIATGTRDGVNIRVILGNQKESGNIITGFSTNVPRNP